MSKTEKLDKAILQEQLRIESEIGNCQLICERIGAIASAGFRMDSADTTATGLFEVINLLVDDLDMALADVI